VQLLARNLGSFRSNGDEKDRNKPSIRSNAVRYLLANLKYQAEGEKTDILKQWPVFRTLFAHLGVDPPGLAAEVLNVLKDHVVADSLIPRKIKTNIFRNDTMGDLRSLCDVQQSRSGLPANVRPLKETAYDFLLLVCTNSSAGVCYPCTGFYPPDTLRIDQRDQGVPANDEVGVESTTCDDSLIPSTHVDLGLDDIEWYHQYHNGVPVHNTILAAFVQTLRPYSSNIDRDLILAILRASPELVADYFFKKTAFTFASKLTATWFGYASFLFEVVRLPLPNHFGAHDGYADVPPPTSLLIECMLPMPLTQNILTKCLWESPGIIGFFAIRILVLSLQKLRTCLQLFREAGQERVSGLWEEAADRLITEFSSRIPNAQDVVSAAQKAREDQPMQRDAVLKLLSLYHEVLPEDVANEKFDVSGPLLGVLEILEKKTVDDDEEYAELRGLHVLMVGHLVQIAKAKEGLPWFKRPASLAFSPFVTLLRLVPTDAASSTGLRVLLAGIVEEHEILQSETKSSGFDGLLASLYSASESERLPNGLFEFLDECITRLTSRRIKYLDDLDAMMTSSMASTASSHGPRSLLVMVLLEQLPFAFKKQADSAPAIVIFIARLLAILLHVGEDRQYLSAVHRAVATTLGERDVRNLLQDPAVVDVSQHIAFIAKTETYAREGTNAITLAEGAGPTKFVTVIEAQKPADESENHPELTRWSKKDVADVIDDGDLDALIICLSSQHHSIRVQALSNLTRFATNLKDSKYEEKGQIWLLLSELVETASPLVNASLRVPYTPTSFAASALDILKDPSHTMYTKVNNFLTRLPSWTIEKMPSYWCDKVLLQPPSEPEHDGRRQEAVWLLAWLHDALNTEQDMEIFRQSGVWERILGLYTHPFASQGNKGKHMRESIMQLVIRAIWCNGSMTLVTRCGILEWLKMRIALKDAEEGLVRNILRKLWETCDNAKVTEWGRGGVVKYMEDVLRTQIAP